MDGYISMRVFKEQGCLAYEALKLLQDGVVPYSYGFYSVCHSISKCKVYAEKSVTIYSPL
jgi:hypothetical protein